MSEMVEQVAKALSERRWKPFNETYKEAARELARDAIAAMREPTSTMIDSGAHAMDVEIVADVNAKNAWQAMIDKALK